MDAGTSSRFFYFILMEELKGIQHGNCNRTACQKPGATWFNHSTKKYYCTECAHIINEYNYHDAMRMFGHDLCTLEDDPLTIDDLDKTDMPDGYFKPFVFKRYHDLIHNSVIAQVSDHGRHQGQKMPSKRAVKAEIRTEDKINRNSICPKCESGLKYKKCCLKIN